MIIAAVQHDIVQKDPAATNARVAPAIEKAADHGAGLVVLTEMFGTGFTVAAGEIAQPMDGPSVTFLRERAGAHGVWLAASVAVQVPGELARNRFVAAGPNGELVTYDKRHPFTYSDEHLEFAPGDDVVQLEIDGLRIT